MRGTPILFLVAGAALAQVQNAADAGAGIFGATPLAAGSLAVVSCSCATETTATVAVRPVGVTAPIAAQVVKVDQNFITFVVPAVPIGDAEIIYKAGSQPVQWTRASIVPSSFALFRSGPVGPLTADNGLANPAQPGQAVVLWGTGLGATAQADIHVALGGVQQTVFYAGAAPGLPGVDQINFRVAPATPDGCYVPLTVTYGSKSVTSFLSKTSDGLPCHHPFGLSTEAMKLLDGGQPVLTGEITMSTAIQAPAADRASRQESAEIFFVALSASGMANVAVSPGPSGQACGFPVASGAIFPGLSVPPAITFGSMTLKSATSTLTLPSTIPQSATSTLTLPSTILPAPDSPLDNLPPPLINAGKWTWSTTGGSGLAASSFDFVLPPPVQLAGGTPLTLHPGADQTIAWDGTAYDTAAAAGLTLSEQKVPPPVITCSAAAQSGMLTIPSSLLRLFEPGYAGALSFSIRGTGTAIPHTLLRQANGSPLLMLVLWTSTDARPVDFQ